MIAFVDTGPLIERHGDLFRLTATSGDGKVELMLTRFALGILRGRINKAFFEAVAAGEPEPIPLRPKRKVRRCAP